MARSLALAQVSNPATGWALAALQASHSRAPANGATRREGAEQRFMACACRGVNRRDQRIGVVPGRPLSGMVNMASIRPRAQGLVLGAAATSS